MPLTNIRENEPEQFVSMFQQLVNEREGLARENEYLKAKMNESVLMETIREMKKERDFLLKLLSNLTKNNQQDEQRNHVHLSKKIHATLPRPTSTSTNPPRIHRFKPTNERIIPMSYPTENAKLPPTSNKKTLVYPAAPPPPIYGSNRIIRKVDIQLKHSPNSPFQQYRSQSLQDLT